MLNLLAKWFIPNHDNTKDPKVRAAYGSLCGIVGIIINILLSALKLVVGLLASSVAAIADAFLPTVRIRLGTQESNTLPR